MVNSSTSQKYRSFSLLFIFFFSGFAALIYQVIWQRWLVFYTGISSVSISLIGLVYVVALHRNKFNSLVVRILMGISLILVIILVPNNEKLWMKLSGMANEKKFIVKEDETALSFIKTQGEESYVNGLGQSMFPFNRYYTLYARCCSCLDSPKS